MVNNKAEDLDGVRISIPLSKIDHINESDCLTFKYFLSVYLPLSAPHPLDSSQTGDAMIFNKVQFVTARLASEWRQLQQYIDVAKHREVSDRSPSIVLDFGPLTFDNGSNDTRTNTAQSPTHNEAVVRSALALGDESEVWSAYLLATDFSYRLVLMVFVDLVARARVHRGIAAAGDFVVSPHFVGFWRKIYTQRSIRYRLPICMVKAATSLSPSFLQRNGLSLVLEGQEDLQFDFKVPATRDHAIQLINAAMEAQFATVLESLSISPPSTPLTISRVSTSSGGEVSYAPYASARNATAILAPLSRTMARVVAADDPDAIRKIMPKLINLPRETLLARSAMHFVCLTIGSRGDVQPYIALGLGLKKEGHRVTIVTHEEYKEWVEGFGIDHRTAGGDPGALMKLSVEHKVGRASCHMSKC